MTTEREPETDKQIARRAFDKPTSIRVEEIIDLAGRLLAADAKLQECMEEIVSLSAEIVSLRNKLNEPVGENDKDT